MPRRCTVCAHPERQAIEDGIASGRDTIRELAVRYGVSKTAVARHGARHIRQRREGPEGPGRNGAGKAGQKGTGRARGKRSGSPADLDPAKVTRLGRPRKYESVEAFEDAVDTYVTACLTDGAPITLTGMALALGFTDRHAMIDYGGLPEFSHAVKRARGLVEWAYELRLVEAKTGGKATGAIFALKQMGWKDEHSLAVGILAGLDPRKVIPLLPDDLVARIAAGEDPAAVMLSASERVRGLLASPALQRSGPEASK